MIVFTFDNQSKSVEATTLPGMAAAIQLAANRDFMPAWNAGVSVSVLADGSTPPGAVKISLVDQAPVADAEGYHEAPGGSADVVIQVPDVPAGELATVISHEVFETLGDWLAILLVDGPFKAPVCFECCDPVEDQTYDVGGFPISNFVLTKWFVSGTSGPWDHLNNLKAPFTLSSGGYIALADGTQQWGSDARMAMGLKPWRRIQRLRLKK